MNYVGLNSLNEAKDKINYLLKQKYGTPEQPMVNNTSVENIPTQFNEIISFINTINQSIFKCLVWYRFQTQVKIIFVILGVTQIFKIIYSVFKYID